MASKAEMVKARVNAYEKGYKAGKLQVSCVVPLNPRPPYYNGSVSKTYQAYIRGYRDSVNGKISNPECVVPVKFDY